MSIANLNYPFVYYGKTALKTVVMQLRFNPILKIAQELPASFQEAIRPSFPKYGREESIGMPFELSSLPGNPAISPLRFAGGPTVWRFKTEDEKWTVGLSVDFISLETGNYSHFSDFESKASLIIEALHNIYGVDAYTRVGLRYINLFSSDTFGGEWITLFNPSLLGPKADPTIGRYVRDFKEVLILGDEQWTITIQHGTENGTYRLDLDHATEANIRRAQLATCLRSFNSRIYQVFRWAITDVLNEQMEPRPRG